MKFTLALILCATLSAQTKLPDAGIYPAVTAPGTPDAGFSRCYIDSNTKLWSCKNDAGVITTGTATPPGSTNDFVTNGGGGVFAAITPASGIAAWLVAPSSTNLAFALTTKSGSGLFVLNDHPTFVGMSLGTGPQTITRTAGTTGTTAGLLVKYDSSGNVVTAATSDVAVIGVAVSTVTLGNPVEVIIGGIAPCVADNTTVIGNFVISGTSTAGRCRDSGTADPATIPTSTQIHGTVRSVATVGNSANIEAFGPGHYGAQITGGGSVTSTSWTGGLVSIANPTTTPAFTVAGTSGGIPYFDSASTWASSGALAANRVVLGGGAGAAPTVAAADTTTTHAFFATAGAPAFRAMVAGDLPGAGALTGDVSGTFPATTVIKINGVTMSGLATGIVKNTTGTGAPSIAVAGDFPTLNQNTTGTAATITGLLVAGNIPKIDVLDASRGCSDAGSNDTYACNLSQAITAYVANTHYTFKANTVNTGAASINFNAVGAKTIVKVAGGITTTLADGDIRAGQEVDLVYDGTNMQIQSTLGNASAGGAGTPCTITGLSFQYNNGGAFGCVGTWTTNGADVTVSSGTIDLSAATLLIPNSAISTAYLNGLYSQLAGINPHAAGTLNIFEHNATNGGIQVKPAIGNPSTLPDGLIWYNSSTPALNARVNGVTVALGGSSSITASSTDTFTNKTIDAEGTGNIITVPDKVYLAAAGCQNATATSFWDLPVSTPAAAACVTGTNTQKGVLDFADTSGGFSAQSEFVLPADFTGAIDARIFWLTSATSGNVKWSLSTICTATAASETDDPAFNTASTVTTAAPGTANRLQTSSITGVTITGCAASENMHLKLFRDGADAADTIGATSRFLGLELTIRRAM